MVKFFWLSVNSFLAFKTQAFKNTKLGQKRKQKFEIIKRFKCVSFNMFYFSFLEKKFKFIL